MGSLIRKAVVQSVLEFAAEIRKTLAARVAGTVESVKAWLPSSIEPVTDAFRGAYTALASALVKWLERPAADGKPGTLERLHLLADRVLTWVEKQAKKLA